MMPHYASSPVNSARSRRSASFKPDRLPAEIISHCVWSYFRCCLSYRDVKGLMDDAARTWTTLGLGLSLDRKRGGSDTVSCGPFP
jgi:hypothetical protein